MYSLNKNNTIPYLDYILIDNTVRLNIQAIVKDNISFLEKYRVIDNETPETLAYDFYGDPDLNWVIMTINNIIDPFHDWVIPDNIFREYLKNKYAPDGDADTVIKYVNDDGVEIPEPSVEADKVRYAITNLDNELAQVKYYEQDGVRISMPNSPTEQISTQVTFLDWEIQENETRRDVFIVRPDRIEQLIYEAKQLLK